MRHLAPHALLLSALLILAPPARAQSETAPEPWPTDEEPSTVDSYGELSPQDDPSGIGPEAPAAPRPPPPPAPVMQETAASTSGPAEDPRERRLGAVVSPAVIPGGGSSFWVSVGAPELAVGFRQGFGILELGGSVRADYLRVGLTAEANARLLALEERWLSLVPTLGVGLTGDTGATYYDDQNVAAISLRVHPGLLAVASLAEIFDLLIAFDAPMDFGFSGDHQRYKMLAGVGGELYVGNDMSVMLMVQGGAEGFRAATGELAWRPTVHARLGIGFRLF